MILTFRQEIQDFEHSAFDWIQWLEKHVHQARIQIADILRRNKHLILCRFTDMTRDIDCGLCDIQQMQISWPHRGLLKALFSLASICGSFTMTLWNAQSRERRRTEPILRYTLADQSSLLVATRSVSKWQNVVMPLWIAATAATNRIVGKLS